MSIEIRMPRLVDSMTQGASSPGGSGRESRCRPARSSPRSRPTRRPWTWNLPRTARWPGSWCRPGRRKSMSARCWRSWTPAGLAARESMRAASRLGLALARTATTEHPRRLPERSDSAWPSAIAAGVIRRVDASPLAGAWRAGRTRSRLRSQAAGPGGRLSAADVLKALGVMPAPERRDLLAGRRSSRFEALRTAAARSKTSPHADPPGDRPAAGRVEADDPPLLPGGRCRIDALLRLRAEIAGVAGRGTEALDQ